MCICVCILETLHCCVMSTCSWWSLSHTQCPQQLSHRDSLTDSPCHHSSLGECGLREPPGLNTCNYNTATPLCRLTAAQTTVTVSGQLTISVCWPQTQLTAGCFISTTESPSDQQQDVWGERLQDTTSQCLKGNRTRQWLRICNQILRQVIQWPGTKLSFVCLSVQGG